MSEMAPRARRRDVALGTQLTVLSLLVLVATLGIGAHAATTVQGLSRVAVEHARGDAEIADFLLADELNEALRADVMARYAGVLPAVASGDGPAGSRGGGPAPAPGGAAATWEGAGDDLQSVRVVAMQLAAAQDPDAASLARDEFSFAGAAERLLGAPAISRADAETFRDQAAVLSRRLDSLRERVTARHDAEAKAADAGRRDALLQLLELTVVVALILFVISRVMRRRLLDALNGLAATARAVASGDLSARTGRAGNDEVGQLAQVLDDTSAALQRAFGVQEAEARRQAFRARLDRALAQVDDDEGLADTVSRALAQVAGTRPAELLIADSSEAHLSTFAVNEGAPAPRCPVSTPWSCPAVRGGRVAEFGTSSDLDACPHLRGRAEGDRSAACVPVSFMGRVLGVLHSASAPGDLPGPETLDQLSALAEQTGARLGNLRAFARIQRQAAVDSLTGLPNRRSFEDAARRLAQKGTRYGLLLADVDRFKAVNDTYGHAAGDQALRLFAKVLRSALREEDLPCRFGGEEFAIILPDLDVHSAADVGDRIRMALAVAVVGNGPEFTVSLGAADSGMARDLAGQLALADAALLAAKRAGRDRCLPAQPLAVVPPPREAPAPVMPSSTP